MKLVIIAGGKGTRLGFTDIPKPMVKIGDSPILEHQINLAKRYEIKDIIILSGYLSNIIIDYFGNGKDFGVNITHMVESKPLGTAGSVKLLTNRLNERFLLFYGDVVMDFDIESFINFDKNKDSIATLIVHPNDHPHDSDLLEIDENNQIIAFHPKPHKEGFTYPNLVNAAVYILSSEIFKYIPSDKSTDFGRDIFPDLVSKNKKLFAYNTPEYIKDMGTKDRYEKVTNDFLNGKITGLMRK